MDYLFLGVDVSKDWLDYAICRGTDKQILGVSKVANTPTGIDGLLEVIREHSATYKVWVCFEHTGNYGLLLAHSLEQSVVIYSMVSSLDILKSGGLTRGKSDPVDAQRIASYAAIFVHKLQPTQLQSGSLLKIKAILTIRDQLVRIRTQLKNAVKSVQLTHQLVDLNEELNLYEQNIASYNSQIAELERRLKGLIKADQAMQTSYEKITQINGIGLITAAAFLVSTHNFTAFDNPRKFNCYCGLAPFEYSSGTSVKRRSRTSQYRNKELKKLLFNAASTAVRHDHQLKAYFKRKTEEGKHKMSVLNAVACKLVYRVFAVVKRDEPYVNFAL